MSIANKLLSGQVGVIPTDTIYGLVGSALSQDTVERIYKLRKRTPTKPMIILISDLSDLAKFSLQPRRLTLEILKKIWPNPVSVILSCDNPNFEYLHRGSKTLAFRMPNDAKLLELLKQTGPLVAPSVNFEGETPAATIQEAKNYFGDEVDFYCEATRSPYIDGGKLESEPSTLIKLTGDKIEIMREGAFKIPQDFVK